MNGCGSHQPSIHYTPSLQKRVQYDYRIRKIIVRVSIYSNTRNSLQFSVLSLEAVFLISHRVFLLCVFGDVYKAGADDGIEEIRASGMILQCLQTVTGIKFVITVAVSDQSTVQEVVLSSTLRDVLKEIYVLYTECVLKDPFYELEMPIRSDLFVQGVDLLIQQKYSLILQKVVLSGTHLSNLAS
jgi:Sybindin-like family